MGCFSGICPYCGHGVESSSHVEESEYAHLLLLKDGVVIEYMSGIYNSYGKVFDLDKPTLEGFNNRQIHDSRQWQSHDWVGVCNLMFSNNTQNGILYIHDDCLRQSEDSLEELLTSSGVLHRSEDDPNQGWGPGWDPDGPFWENGQPPIRTLIKTTLLNK